MVFSRTVAVSGANRGLGYEFVNQLSRESQTLVIAYCRKSSEILDKLAQKENVKIVNLEIGDSESIKRAAKETAEITGGKLDVLINSAAVNPGPNRVSTLSDVNVIKETMNINIYGLILLTNALLPLIKAGKEKKIISISSGCGSVSKNLTGLRNTALAPYAISKAALNMTSAQYAVELDDEKIVSVVLDPGWCKTDMGGSGAKLEPADSVATMLKRINSLTMEDSGRFYGVVEGEVLTMAEVPW